MWFSGDRNRICTHQSTTVLLASQNKINGGNEEREGMNVGEIKKRGREWTNRMENGGFGDGWDCHLLEIIVSR